MDAFSFCNPTRIEFGVGTIRKLGMELKKADIKSCLMVAGSGSIKKNGVYEQQLKVQDGFLAVPMTDLQTIKEVKEELIQVINELAELEENCDYARADELRDIYEKLSKYLRDVYHKDCKIRHFTCEESKIKRRVVRAVNRALEEIEIIEPELAKELRKSIEFGKTICYHQRRKIEVFGYWK